MLGARPGTSSMSTALLAKGMRLKGIVAALSVHAAAASCGSGCADRAGCEHFFEQPGSCEDAWVQRKCPVSCQMCDGGAGLVQCSRDEHGNLAEQVVIVAARRNGSAKTSQLETPKPADEASQAEIIHLLEASYRALEKGHADFGGHFARFHLLHNSLRHRCNSHHIEDCWNPAQLPRLPRAPPVCTAIAGRDNYVDPLTLDIMGSWHGEREAGRTEAALQVRSPCTEYALDMR